MEHEEQRVDVPEPVDPGQAQNTVPPGGPVHPIEPTSPRAQPTPPVIDRALLDRIFGDVLPEITSDEEAEPGPRPDRDDWYRANRPPHHGQ